MHLVLVSRSLVAVVSRTMEICKSRAMQKWLLILIIFPFIFGHAQILALTIYRAHVFICIFVFCLLFLSLKSKLIIIGFDFISFMFLSSTRICRVSECHDIHATQRFMSAIWATMHAKMNLKTRSATMAHCEASGSQEIHQDLVNILSLSVCDCLVGFYFSIFSRFRHLIFSIC